MSLMVELENGLEERVRHEADKRGIDARAYARQLVESGLENPRHPLSIELQSWIDKGDEEEQRETLDAIMTSLKEYPLTFREVHLD